MFYVIITLALLGPRTAKVSEPLTVSNESLLKTYFTQFVSQF